MHYYLVDNVQRAIPESVPRAYTHIKGRADGDVTMIVSKEPIEHDCLSERTFEETKTILDEWIDAENESVSLDDDGNEIIQEYIDLAKVIRVLYG